MSDSVIFTFCFVSLYFENIIFNITSKHFSVFVFQKHLSNIVIQTNFQMWTPQHTFQFSNTENNFQITQQETLLKNSSNRISFCAMVQAM